jgi:hypothetical protein
MTAGGRGVEPNSGETKQKWGGYQRYFVTDPDRPVRSSKRRGKTAKVET